MRIGHGVAGVGVLGAIGLQLVGLMGTFAMGEGVCLASSRSGQLHGGSQVVVRVRGAREKALRLQSAQSGWSFSVDMPTDGSQCVADLRDVTPLPTGLLKWTERLSNQEPQSRVLLTPDRYVPGHAYRVTVRCGARELSRSVVYLAPTARGGRASQIALSDAEVAGAEQASEAQDDDELAMVPKGSL